MISIVTITFNNFDELKATLDSIQGVQGIQSIVINGGSCEKTRNYLQYYSGIAISEKDYGIADAFNKGLRQVTGDAVMFLNSGDTLIDKTYIEEVNHLMKNDPAISYFHSDILYDDMMLGPIHIKSTSKPRSLAKGMPYPHQSLIIRKSVFDAVGAFDQSFRLVMDYDFVLRMYKINAKGYHVSRMTVRMDGGGVSSKSDYRILNENFIALKKNGFLTPLVCLRLMLSYVITTVKIVLGKLHCIGLLKMIKRLGRKVEV